MTALPSLPPTVSGAGPSGATPPEGTFAGVEMSPWRVARLGWSAVSSSPAETASILLGATRPGVLAVASAVTAGAAFALPRPARRAAASVAAGVAAVAVRHQWARARCTAAVPAARPSARQGRLRVLAVNVLESNAAAGSALDELTATWDPDVVVVAEADHRARRAMAASGFFEGWPHVTDLGAARTGRPPRPARQVRDDVVIASRVPFEASTVEMRGCRWRLATFDRFGLSVLGVHTSAPTLPGRGRAAWRAQLAQLPAALADVPGPVIACGDFNAGWGNAPLRAAAAAAGMRGVRAPGGTWAPSTSRRAPAVLGLDQVLVRNVVVAACTVVPAPGSDHRAVVFDVA